MAVNNIVSRAKVLTPASDGRWRFNDPSGLYVSGGSVTYDTRVGLGADVAGIPILAKHANAQYIYWNPTHGNASDANPGTSPSAPKATLASAWAALRTGYGDWLLMAQGASVSYAFGGVPDRSGLSASYPIVVTTYDPAAPTTLRQGKVTVGTGGGDRMLEFYDFTGANIVFENIDFARNEGSPYAETLWGLYYDNPSTHAWNMMFHNCRFIRGQVSLQGSFDSSAYIGPVIFRHCTFAKAAGGAGHTQGMYLWGTNGITVEDCVFYHNGWSDDGTRDTASDPPDIYKHNMYFGTATFNTIVRRCVSGHSSSHGLQLRGGGICNDNLFASNPVNLLIGGGNSYNVYRPSGVPYTALRNVISGSSDIDSATDRGFGVLFENTQDGGQFGQNLVCNVGALSTGNRRGFVASWMSETFGLPTYIYMTGNIFWQWNDNWNTGVYSPTLDTEVADGATPTYFSHDNDIIQFDTTPDGTNRQTPVTAFPDPSRTVGTYATANGYASESALWEAMIANPKTHWAGTINAYIRSGYNMTVT